MAANPHPLQPANPQPTVVTKPQLIFSGTISGKGKGFLPGLPKISADITHTQDVSPAACWALVCKGGPGEFGLGVLESRLERTGQSLCGPKHPKQTPRRNPANPWPAPSINLLDAPQNCRS
jgi:hypothetical protein